MSGAASTEPGAASASARAAAPPPEQAQAWRVRAATASDVSAVAEIVRELLLELGGTPAPASPIEVAARELIEDRDGGALLVAETRDGLVGLLGASWQSALHIPGRYGLIQELWVHPSWRGQTIGGDLLDAVFALARELRIARVEVGLPQDGFAGIGATEAFYRGNGFKLLGARMRRTLV